MKIFAIIWMTLLSLVFGGASFWATINELHPLSVGLFFMSFGCAASAVMCCLKTVIDA